MSDLRPRKETDKQETQKAFQILKKAMQDHPEIEQTLWAGACWSCLITGYLNSGISYKEFVSECSGVKKHYKHWWGEKDS